MEKNAIVRSILSVLKGRHIEACERVCNEYQERDACILFESRPLRAEVVAHSACDGSVYH